MVLKFPKAAGVAAFFLILVVFLRLDKAAVQVGAATHKHDNIDGGNAEYHYGHNGQQRNPDVRQVEAGGFAQAIAGHDHQGHNGRTHAAQKALNPGRVLQVEVEHGHQRKEYQG